MLTHSYFITNGPLLIYNIFAQKRNLPRLDGVSRSFVDEAL